MWDDEIKQKKTPSLFRAVFKNYWLQMFMYSMICVIEVGILLYKVILYSLPPSLLARIPHSLPPFLPLFPSSPSHFTMPPSLPPFFLSPTTLPPSLPPYICSSLPPFLPYSKPAKSHSPCNSSICYAISMTAKTVYPRKKHISRRLASGPLPVSWSSSTTHSSSDYNASGCVYESRCVP